MDHIHKVILSTFSVYFKETIINIRYLFLLLKIERIKDMKIKKKGHQYKVEYPKVPNLIYSARYGPNTRGVITSDKETYLKNSLCLHTTSENKNIHVKMFKSNIEISGAQDLDEVIEITEYLRCRIFKIQKTLEFMKSHPENTLITLDWVKRHTKGAKTLAIKGTNHLPKDNEPIYEKDNQKYVLISGKITEVDATKHPINIVRTKILKEIENNINYDDDVPSKRSEEWTSEQWNSKLSIKEKKGDVYTFNERDWLIEGEVKELETIWTPRAPDEYEYESYPAGVNMEIAELLLDKIFWFHRYRDYCRVVSALCCLDSVCDSKMEYDAPKTSMIFINFYINFAIDIEKIYMLPLEKFKGFYLIQDDDNTKFVKLQMPYTIPDALKSLIKTNPKKGKVHTIQIYSQGRITICGPHLELNEIVKRKIINLLHTMRSDISLKPIKINNECKDEGLLNKEIMTRRKHQRPVPSVSPDPNKQRFTLEKGKVYAYDGPGEFIKVAY